MGSHVRWVVPSNCIEIPAGPLLQKYGQERAHEAEHEANEPDRVDKYYGSRRDEGTTDRCVQKSTGITVSCVRELLGYLCEERLSDDVGILLQALIADGNKSGHS
jgi:hypothetical protein